MLNPVYERFHIGFAGHVAGRWAEFRSDLFSKLEFALRTQDDDFPVGVLF
jgi:hypothetical protein